MKKTIYLSLLLLMIFGLASCKKGVEAGDITVQVVSEIIETDSIDVHLVIPVELNTEAELYEIVMNVASQTYEKYFDTIGSSTYSLIIHCYATSAEYDANTQSYGQLSMMINETITNPGLTLDQNDLTFE
ncbi:MAG: hypothetical protein JXC31_03110 [Acholeplasmataceae bacterium]|nr:hypothetical protein [Acholeplasmataceae bacterium]